MGPENTACAITTNQFDMETSTSNDDRELWSLVSSPCGQSAPLRAVQPRRGGVVLRVGVPFTQVSHGAAGGAPSIKCKLGMTYCGAKEKGAQSQVPDSWLGCLLDEHMLAEEDINDLLTIAAERSQSYDAGRASTALSPDQARVPP